ncbi:MAG TPA: cyclodeaminase/cyclohydrolase family protein [Bacilli bacterium]|nr:cyclodeaminase/cyclohydrolase family protein [Bacilli bacterium]
MKLIDLSVKEFIDTVDSNQATPGGGSVSALSIAQGIGLIRMVAHLTIGKKKFLALEDGVKSNYMSQFLKLETLKHQAMQIVDLDTDAFNVIMDAFKLPKSTDEEIAKRNDVIKQATLQASKVPHDAAKIALEALRITKDMVPYANKNAISDLGVGSLLMMAGVEGAILNIKTNMIGFDEKQIVTQFDQFCDETMDQARAISSEILSFVHQSLNLK